ncbi:MAG: DUF6628 family protein [Parasphingopyxis sp.]|nr:hypothetical protein [Sphingomonadales bacterium]
MREDAMPPTAAALLPHCLPGNADARILLFAMRRMAICGLRDAHAAQAFFLHFGLGYRRPLVLLRALLVEMAHEARGSITIAPCCAPRMSADERAILGLLASPETGRAALASTLGRADAIRTLDLGRALTDALASAGRPVRL